MGLIIIPVGTVGHFAPWYDSFWAVWGPVDSVPDRALGSHALVAFRGLSCWQPSLALSLWFGFGAWSKIAIGGCFVGLPVVDCGSCWSGGSFCALVGLFRAVGGPVGCVWDRGLSARARLAFQGLSHWQASLALCLWFRF